MCIQMNLSGQFQEKRKRRKTIRVTDFLTNTGLRMDMDGWKQKVDKDNNSIMRVSSSPKGGVTGDSHDGSMREE